MHGEAEAPDIGDEDSRSYPSILCAMPQAWLFREA